MTNVDGEKVVGVLPSCLTILPTYKCTAACEHCCFQSNPKITHRVPQSRLLGYIDEAAALGTISVVCFSGGEPLVIGSDLAQLIERSCQHGLITRVVSNASFAVNEQTAQKRIGSLVAAGLNEINFSTGDDHAKFVPIENVALAASVALGLGLTVMVMVEDKLDRQITRQKFLEKASLYNLLSGAIESGVVSIVESPWMEFKPSGDPVAHNQTKLVNRDNVKFRPPCSSVLTTMVISPSEELGACCGLPREDIPHLRTGSLKNNSMADLVNKSLSDFMNIWLFVEGPERILAWAAEKRPEIEWENRYAHNCDACRALFGDKVVLEAIADHWEEKYDELLLKFSLMRPDVHKEKVSP